MSKILEERLEYKPFQYPWAYDAFRLQNQIHWNKDEVPLEEDVRDWNSKLTLNEQSFLTQIFRFFTQADIDVASGYIDRFMPIFKHPELRMMMSSFANMECFDKETELLTTQGWINVQDIDYSHKVAQYNLESEELSWAQPTKVHKYEYEGAMHHYQGLRTDIMVTPNHDLIQKHPSSHKVTKKKSDVNKLKGNYYYPCAGTVEGDLDLRISELLLLVAIQADGCLRGLCPKSKDTHGTVDIHIAKTRKKNRLVALLGDCGLEYSRRIKPRRIRELGKYPTPEVFTFNINKLEMDVDITKVKSLEFLDLENMNTATAEIILDEISKWDSSIISATAFQYYSKNKEAVDKVQAVAVLAGKCCNVGINHPDGTSFILPQGREHILEGDLYVATVTDYTWKMYPKKGKTEVDYNDFVYCVSVPQGNVVTRRNGKTAITGNSVHIEAYSALIDTIGMPESEYSAFMEFSEMKDKHDYLSGFDTGISYQLNKPIEDYSEPVDMDKDMHISKDSLEGLAKSLAVYAAFTEGLQLFSSFVMLLNFPRFGKMKGMGQIVTWSIRDESLHVESMMRLFRTLIQENPSIWTDNFKKELYDVAREMVELEDKFIDLAFALGGIEGLTPEEVKEFIRYIADKRLLQLGLKPNFGVKENPLPWYDDMLNAVEHTNFFENRATEYAKGTLIGSMSEEVWGKTKEKLDG